MNAEEPTGVPKRRRPTVLPCAWCGEELRVLPVGRVPTWCSNSCRHRAWEQRRAAVSGLVSREVVERVVEVEVPVEVVREVEVEVVPRGAAWTDALQQLAEQLDRGVVYDRDLDALTAGLSAVSAAILRRRAERAGMRR